MFYFFKRTIESTDDIEKLLNSDDPSKGGEILRNEADNESLTCQIFLAGMYLHMMNTEERPAIFQNISTQLIKCAVLASERGDVFSQCNLGKYYLTLVSKDIKEGAGKLSEHGCDNLRDAKKYLSMAASQKMPEAIESLSNLNELFDGRDSGVRVNAPGSY